MQGDNAQAIEYFDKSLARFQTDGDHVGMARMLSFIGNARYVQGQYDLALVAYEQSR
jgi:tetratricopeptide (TPR) repeat protein